ncbi:MAG: SRPBCC family protein, partial [Actinomycetes bacterium]
MRHALRTEIDIPATPEELWRILTDLAGYADWNPFITSAAGAVAPGERLSLRMEPPGGWAMSVRPAVTEADPMRVLEWLGRLGVPGLFDGRHRFELQPIAGGTR